jgi:hypothetical protein
MDWLLRQQSANEIAQQIVHQAIQPHITPYTRSGINRSVRSGAEPTDQAKTGRRESP